MRISPQTSGETAVMAVMAEAVVGWKSSRTFSGNDLWSLVTLYGFWWFVYYFKHLLQPTGVWSYRIVIMPTSWGSKRERESIPWWNLQQNNTSNSGFTQFHPVFWIKSLALMVKTIGLSTISISHMTPNLPLTRPRPSSTYLWERLAGRLGNLHARQVTQFWWSKLQDFIGFSTISWLVVSTPLKNMSSSVGIIIPNIWKK